MNLIFYCWSMKYIILFSRGLKTCGDIDYILPFPQGRGQFRSFTIPLSQNPRGKQSSMAVNLLLWIHYFGDCFKVPGISFNNISSNSFFLSTVSLRLGFNVFVLHISAITSENIFNIRYYRCTSHLLRKFVMHFIQGLYLKNFLIVHA
jgi:hypothetical protein